MTEFDPFLPQGQQFDAGLLFGATSVALGSSTSRNKNPAHDSGCVGIGGFDSTSCHPAQAVVGGNRHFTH
ncbi:MAG TPA: hypothetical protein VNZ03_28085 [Terriglobales bacterium]|nr:hypothetical protein [Terriglobales bacterium]